MRFRLQPYSLGQNLDVPVGSMHADPLPVSDQAGGLPTPTTAGKPYSRAITAPWVIRPPPPSPGP